MKFLVATDGSEKSRAALDYALDLAGGGDTVTVVHAVDPDVYSEGGSEPITDLSDADERLLVETVEDAERRGSDILEEATAHAADRGAEVETDLLYGAPLQVVPEYASREGFDTIVVGHRGLTERAERVVGSVAKGLVSRSPLPVVVVP